MQQAAPPPATGAASCRPRDGDAWPAVTGPPAVAAGAARLERPSARSAVPRRPHWAAGCQVGPTARVTGAAHWDSRLGRGPDSAGSRQL